MPITVPHMLMALAITLVWGLTFVAAKFGLAELPPLFFTGVRFGLIALVLLPWLKLPPGGIRAIVPVALANGAGHFSLMYIGLSLSENVSSIAIAMQLMMPFSVILAVVFLGEHIGPRRIAGIVLAFAGIMLVGFDPVVFNHIDGLLFCITAAFVAATGLVLMRTLKGVGVYQLQAWVGAVSAPQLLILSLIFEWNSLPMVLDASWLAWGGMAYTAIGASLLGHAGWYWLLQRYEVQLMSPIGLLASVWAVIFGVTIFGDVLSDKLLLGGALTLTGVLIVMLLHDRTRTVEAVSERNA